MERRLSHSESKRRLVLLGGLGLAFVVALGLVWNTVNPHRAGATTGMDCHSTGECSIWSQTYCCNGNLCVDWVTNNYRPDPSCNLSITNVSESYSATDATITWTTNYNATGLVRYGTTTAYGTVVNQAAPAGRGHSVTITGLSPGTTYHYQVESTSTARETPSGDTKTSVDRSFTTPTGTGTGTRPEIRTGPVVDAIDTQADVEFTTNVQTVAMVEYSTDPETSPVPGGPGYQVACNSAALSCPPNIPPQASELSTSHTIRISGFTDRKKYFYKVTVWDAAGTSFSTSEFQFTTSASSTDHVFSTGRCDDGTEIGKCNGGKYCRPGGGMPVPDCRPSSPCPSACPNGQSCQSSGDCTQDPTLTGSPTQCNARSCYLQCDGNSGAIAGQRCDIDDDCRVVDPRGKCVLGSFVNPARSGCYASWPSCDANTILKVRPDRVCDKWLTCKTSVTVEDETGKKENQCLSLSGCNSLGTSGQCNSYLEGRQCSNDPLRFCTKDADCPGGTCLLGGTHAPLTYKTPENVSAIQNLSGYAYAGLDWTQEAGTKIPGYYPLNVAPVVGSEITFNNSDFETQVLISRCCAGATCQRTDPICDPSTVCTAPATCRQDTATLEEGVTLYWDPIPDSSKASVNLDTDGPLTAPNHSMKVTPLTNDPAGTRTSSRQPFESTATTRYLLAVRLRSQQQDQPIKVSLVNEAGTETIFQPNPLKLSTSWQTYHLGPIPGPGGKTFLQFMTTVTGTPVPFWVDDVSIIPALQVADDQFIAQSCRLYPRDDAPACDYTDKDGFSYSGIKGFCLERDPLNSAICLSWWPVDDVKFGADELAVYAGRRPLYACAESDSIRKVSDVHKEGWNSGALAGIGFSSSNVFGGRYVSKAGNGCLPEGGIQYYNGVLYTSGCRTLPNCNLSSCAWIPNYDWATLIMCAIKGSTIDNKQVATGPEKDLPESSIGSVKFLQTYSNWIYGQCDRVGGPGTRCLSCANYIPNDWPYYIEFTNDDFTATGTTKYFVSVGNKRLFDVSPIDNTVAHGFTNVAVTASKTNSGGNTIWQIQTDQGRCWNGVDRGACFTLQLKFTNGKFTEYEWDASGYVPSYYDVLFKTKETCDKVVQVADATNLDTAWLDRTSSSSTYVVPELNYRYRTDLAPFGATAQPELPNPESWPQLGVEGATPLSGDPSKFAARAGFQYACNGPCPARRCDYGAPSKRGLPCYDSSECSDGLYQGRCIGASVCLRWDDKRKDYDVLSSTKASCDANRTSSGACPAGKTCCRTDDPVTATVNEAEECVGGAGSSVGVQAFSGSADTPSSTGQYFAEYHLKRLFTSALGWWDWSGTTLKYEFKGTEPWKAPDKLCKVCVGAGANAGLACTSAASCGAGYTCDQSDIRPTLNADQTNDFNADYCAVKPSVVILDSGSRVTLDEGNAFTLKLLSKVDPQQRPLRYVKIDWGDETIVEGPLSIKPRDDPKNPHIFTHNYSCPFRQGCEYQIRVQIEDNWKWCDNGVDGTPCKRNPSDWNLGPKVFVRR